MPEQMVIDLSSKRPERKKKTFWVLVTISLAALTASLYASGGILMLCALGGWLMTFVALFIAAKRVLSRSVEKTSAGFGLVLVILLLIAHSKVALLTQWTFARILDCRLVAMTSLKSLGTAIHSYANQEGAYPECLTTLTKANTDFVHPKNLIAPLDPGCKYVYSYNDSPPGLVYSSYEYIPGQGPWTDDPKIVLAYEYAPWHPMRLQLFPEYGRYVLFADNRVELLDAISFNHVLREDIIRRRELGWPQQTRRPVAERQD